MKKLLLIFSVLIFGITVHAQAPVGRQNDSVRRATLSLINQYRTLQITPVRHDKMLVSYYTWKALCKADFSTLTGLDNSATVGSFAALNVNQNNSTFTFTPISWTDQITKSNFRFIQSIDFSGTVDKNSLFDLKNWRTVSLSYSFTWVFDKGYYFKKGERGTPKHKPLDASYIRLYDELEHIFRRSYRSTQRSTLAELNHPEFEDKDDLKQAWLDSVAKYEKLLIKDSWTVKRFGWLKATATPLSFDNADFIVTGDSSTYNTPSSKSYYTPALLLSGNYYWGFAWGGNIYISLYIQGAYKDSFTDIATAAEWNKVKPLTDSSSVNVDTKNVYTVTDSHIRRKLLPNTGGELILLAPLIKKRIGFGVDLSLAYNGLVPKAESDNNGWLQNFQAGLIISLKDKTGASTINVEPYYQKKRYIDFTADANHLWGVKLSIPFGRLY